MKHLVLPLLLLGACADPAAQHLGGVGDPVRGAAIFAPDTLSDTSRLQGQPAAAVLAAVQMEVIADAFETDPRHRHTVSGSALHAARVGRREFRQAAGIAPDAPPALVIARLRQAAAALEAGRVDVAEAALSGPAFPAGGAATLARLASLPPLPRVRDAAGAAFFEISRSGGGDRF